MTGLIDRKTADVLYEIEHVPGLGPTDISWWLTGIDSSSAVMNRLDWLHENGFITKDRGRIIDSMMIRLTPLGKRLARFLHKMDREMGWDAQNDNLKDRWSHS